MLSLITKLISELIASALIMLGYIKYVLPIIMESYPDTSKTKCLGLFIIYSIIGYYLTKMLSYFNSEPPERPLGNKNRAVVSVYLLSKLFFLPGKIFLTPVIDLINIRKMIK